MASTTPTAPTSTESVQQQAPAATTGSAPSASAAAAASGGSGSSAVFSESKSEAAEILRQADLLQQQNVQLQQELAEFRAQKEEETKQYAASQEPKLDEYLKALEARQGTLAEKEKSVIRAAFTNPKYKRDGERMWKDHQELVSVAASAKAQASELVQIKAERDRLLETQTKLSQSLGPSAMRASYASALAPDSIPSAGASLPTKDAGVSASGLSLTEVMGVMPSATEKELGFLQQYHFPTEFGVRASNGSGKQLRMSMPAPAEHRLLLDPITGERNFPASMRYQHPHIFARYVNDRSYLDGDSVHASVVVRNAAGDFVQPINDISEIK